MLYIVTGDLTIYHYPDSREHEKFTHLVEAANEDEVQVIIDLMYELKEDPYATSYSPTITNIEGTISMATIQEMQNAKRR